VHFLTEARIDHEYVELPVPTKARSFTLTHAYESIADTVKMNAHYKFNLVKRKNSIFKPEEHIPLSSANKYENFHTIDWLRDLTKDRYRHRWLERQKANGGLLEHIQKLNDAWAGWMCVLLVAISAGLVAGMIDIGAGWMENLKAGICKNSFWLNREQCCWASKFSHENKYNRINCDEVSFGENLD
jgi:hypothetical protein